VTALLAFAVLLVAAVLVSERAGRTVLSTSVVFLAGGFVAGPALAGLVAIEPTNPQVAGLVEHALVAVLFVEGGRLAWPDVRRQWRLPARALALGLPLTLLAIAGAARLLLPLDWTGALLLGALLAPTDPVFAEAVVGERSVPPRVRHALNLESGVNDGIALPAVLVLLALARSEPPHPGVLAAQVAGGIAIGACVPAVVLRLERLPFFGAADRYQPLLALSIGFLAFALASATHANTLLAAFVAGSLTASLAPGARDAFAPLGRSIAELLKLGALLVFGIVLSRVVGERPLWPSLLLGLAVVLLARPLALAPALAGARLPRREWLTLAWFGPRGFASVFFALIVYGADVQGAHVVFHAAAITVALSMVAHSSTDVLVARSFRVQAAGAPKPQAVR
jgi:NhaP-type Na+/H+ or K+/H+ antiporter